MNVLFLRFLRQSLAALFLLACGVQPSQSQTTNSVRGTAVITGRLLIGEKPAANVMVGLVRADLNMPTSNGAAAKTPTDSEGRFRLDQIVAGNYRVTPLAPGYVVAGESPGFFEQALVSGLR